MVEERRLLDLKEGRTGVVDPLTGMIAVGLAVGGARMIHNNSAVVRGLVSSVRSKFGKTPPPAPRGELILPFGWERKHTFNGLLFHNSKTNETRNTPPPDSYEEHIGEDGKPYWHSDGTGKTVFVRPGQPAPPPDHNALPTNWTEHENNGQKFYHNALTGVSQHERPTAPGPPIPAPPVTQTNSKKNRNKQAAAVPVPTQPTPNKGRSKEPAAVPRIDPFAAPRKMIKIGDILGHVSSTKLLEKLASAVSELKKRMPEVDDFVTSNYKSIIEKYDVEHLKVEGLKRRPPIVYAGVNKSEILPLLVQAEFDASHDLVSSWKDAVLATETELAALTETITTSRSTVIPKGATKQQENSFFAPVVTGLEKLTQKIAATNTAYNKLKNKLGTPAKNLMTKTLGSISACRTIVLLYMANMAKMRKS